jgi:hypothetical protein
MATIRFLIDCLIIDPENFIKYSEESEYWKWLFLHGEARWRDPQLKFFRD